MSAERDFGGFAFPLMPPCDASGDTPSGYPFPENGMTLRDYAAIHADISSFDFGDAKTAGKAVGLDDVPGDDAPPLELVRFSARVNAALRYILADAMLAERRKP